MRDYCGVSDLGFGLGFDIERRSGTHEMFSLFILSSSSVSESIISERVRIIT
jgi:hypothetical protein